jgi:hypothetical protein
MHVARLNTHPSTHIYNLCIYISWMPAYQSSSNLIEGDDRIKERDLTRVHQPRHPHTHLPPSTSHHLPSNNHIPPSPPKKQTNRQHTHTHTHTHCKGPPPPGACNGRQLPARLLAHGGACSPETVGAAKRRAHAPEQQRQRQQRWRSQAGARGGRRGTGVDCQGGRGGW